MRTKEEAGGRLYPTEEQEQTVVMHWAAMAAGRWPELRMLFHIPNGGKRTKTEAARFRAAGVRSGVPDLFLPCARGGYHGLWIEMKAVGGAGAMAAGAAGGGVSMPGVLRGGRGDCGVGAVYADAGGGAA